MWELIPGKQKFCERKMRSVFVLLLFFLPGSLFATSVMPRSLTNLVADADHVIIGKVTLVDMVDEKGNQVTNLTARTGPGLGNTIRLHVSVETNGVLFTTANQVPATLTIDLCSMWHYSLEQIKQVEEHQTSVFLLKGSHFGAVYPAYFSRALTERAEIEKLLTIKATQKAVEPTRAPDGARGSP